MQLLKGGESAVIPFLNPTPFPLPPIHHPTQPTSQPTTSSTGVFKGAYTIDEQDEFVWTGKGVVEMWLLCIPPLFGWVVVAWLIFTHERVTCFNYHKVLHVAA
jgi:hypothetical protein